jgi:arginyl-tRNA synthetase
MEDLNKKIYEGSDKKVMQVYEEGRKASLAYFESIYKRLGTAFDYYFFESETALTGKKIVEDNLGKVFEESEGAVVFKAETYDKALHTRVFINSQGLPTYEAKDLGNAKNKYEKYPYTISVVVTGNEIKDYFRVVLMAMKQVLPKLAEKTKHMPHGMLRLPTGKMSSRTGDVITAESLIQDVKEKVKGDEAVAIAAIKYMILRQAIGNDIIFDIEKSVSTEGDSGVYLQYAHARASSILEKAGKKGDVKGESGEVREVERLLYRFPEIVERAGAEYAPNYITTYLTELAAAFNNFYAHEQVLVDSPEAGYRLAIVEAFKQVMKNGLTILGIPAPEKM